MGNGSTWKTYNDGKENEKKNSSFNNLMIKSMWVEMPLNKTSDSIEM